MLAFTWLRRFRPTPEISDFLFSAGERALPPPPQEIRKASGAVTRGVCVSINRLNRKQQNIYGHIEKGEFKKKNLKQRGVNKDIPGWKYKMITC